MKNLLLLVVFGLLFAGAEGGHPFGENGGKGLMVAGPGSGAHGLVAVGSGTGGG